MLVKISPQSGLENDNGIIRLYVTIQQHFIFVQLGLLE
jgi:hypothetical protein